MDAPPTSRPQGRFGLRLLACCVFLVGLCMAQSPGLMVADTKFDLVADPRGFLERALYLWDAEGSFGQLQNQAYGYLWPMGPLFFLGALVDLPGWVVQRLWQGLVLCVAMVGAARVGRALGVRSDLACLVGGFAYALSPRMLTTIGPTSIEAWPSALAPWVLLPLVIGSRSGSAVRAAALSAVAVAMVGGVNAAATFAVLPLGALWVLTRSRGARRRSLMIWWPLFTALGTAWWLVPLFLMGSYSPPFLDFIESASTTTFPTTVFDALRGTSDWVAYLDPSWRAGNDLVREFYLPLNSGVVLLLGLAGIMSRSSPHRLFLASGVVLGLCLVTLGHTGSVQGWAAADLQQLLDGVLAPLRNIHKFDPVVRLPLVLGLALLVDQLVARAREAADTTADTTDGAPSAQVVVTRVNAYVLVGAAVVGVVGAAIPAVAARMEPADGLQSVPTYWSDASRWLEDRGAEGTALLLPGSSFADYVWGFPRDEPMQWLATTPWAVRSAVPLTPPGAIRMLDAVERRLAQGRPSPGLATYLRRAGISHLVVRNDLARSADVPDPVLVHQTLDNSPGLFRAATFGPVVGGEAFLRRELGRVLVNGGWQTEYPAIEIYRVGGSAGPAVGVDGMPVVVGGPEDLLDLVDLGILGREPAVLALDTAEPPDGTRPLVLTDGLRTVERHFGRVHDGSSATLGPGDERRLGNPTRDYLMDEGDRWGTTATLEGIRAVSASSSMSDANAAGTVQPGLLPFAAVDGEVGTAWQASSGSSRTAWWQVDFLSPRPLESVRIRAGLGQPQVVRVRTTGGLTTPLRVPAGTSRTVKLDGTATAWLRIEDATGRPGHDLALAEVEVPGLTARRPLVLPTLPEGWPNPVTIVLRAVDDARTGCVEVEEEVRCVEGRQVVGEEPLGFARRFDLPEAEEYDATLRVRGRPGAAWERLLTAGLPAGISASSRGVEDSRGSALAAVDGDPGTTWTAALADPEPVLSLNWLGERRISGLSLRVDESTAARLPSKLTLVWPGGRRVVSVDDDGDVRFPPLRTDRLDLRVEEARPATSLDFQNRPSEVPVGVSEVRLRGLPLLPLTLPDTPVSYPCGTGPTVVADGRLVPTALTASPQELYGGAEVTARLCGDPLLALSAGTNEVRVEASETFVPTSLVLGDEALDRTGVHEVGYRSEDPVHLTLLPTDDDTAVIVRRNFNEGWQATQGGSELESLRADGWQQGWELAGDDEVRAEFVPDRVYSAGLLAGGVLLLVLLGVARVATWRWPGFDAPPVGTRTARRVVVVPVALLVGGLLAGWTGVGLSLVGLLLVATTSGRLDEAGRWAAAALVLPAAAGYAIRPWGDEQGWAGGWDWPHYLVVVASAALLGWVASDAEVERAGRGRLDRPRFFRRIPGISTRR